MTADAPGLYEPVLVSRGSLSGGAYLKGIIPKDERTVSGLLTNLVAGSAAELSSDADATGPDAATPPLVIGYDLLAIHAYGVEASISRAVRRLFGWHPTLFVAVVFWLGILVGHIWLPTE